jgi:hypothetical protein
MDGMDGMVGDGVVVVVPAAYEPSTALESPMGRAREYRTGTFYFWSCGTIKCAHPSTPKRGK